MDANTVDPFPINADGTLGTEVTTPSSAPEAFAGEFTRRGFAVVAQSSGSVTSYSLGANGAYFPISANVPTEGDETCWIMVTPKHLFTSNTASANISGFSISATGALTRSAAPWSVLSRPAASISI